MKISNLVAGVAAGAILSGAFAGAALAADPSSVSPTPSVSTTVSVSPTPSAKASESVVVPSATPVVTVKETVIKTVSPDGKEVTKAPEPLPTVPSWLQPSSREEQAIDVIVKIGTAIAAIAVLVSGLATLVKNVQPVRDQLRRMLGR